MSAVLGRWELAMKTPIGTIAAIYTFAPDTEGIHGQARGTAETVPLEDIVVETAAGGAERVRWRQSVTKPMRLNLHFEVTVDGDEMTGVSRAGRLPRTPVNGRRSSS